jgi:hypothetical protein
MKITQNAYVAQTGPKCYLFRQPMQCQSDFRSCWPVGCSASGNGRSVYNPCRRVCLTCSSRPALLFLSLPKPSKVGRPSLYLLLRLSVYVVSRPYNSRYYAISPFLYEKPRQLLTVRARGTHREKAGPCTSKRTRYMCASHAKLKKSRD